MGFGTGCVKCCLNTINTLWAITGVVGITIGYIFYGSGPHFLSILLCVIGAINLIGGILGCCGICQEHVCLTSAYAVFILLSLALQFVVMIAANDVEKIKSYAKDDVAKLWEKEIIEPGSMNITQAVYHCCGVNGPEDYDQLHRPYPESCSGETINELFGARFKKTRLFENGCLQVVERMYVGTVTRISKGTWGSVICTVIILIFVIYLIIRFRRKQRHYNY